MCLLNIACNTHVEFCLISDDFRYQKFYVNKKFYTRKYLPGNKNDTKKLR